MCSNPALWWSKCRNKKYKRQCHWPFRHGIMPFLHVFTFSPLSQGSLLSTMIFVYTVTSSVCGYSGGALYARMGGVFCSVLQTVRFIVTRAFLVGINNVCKILMWIEWWLKTCMYLHVPWSTMYPENVSAGKDSILNVSYLTFWKCTRYHKTLHLQYMCTCNQTCHIRTWLLYVVLDQSC